MSEFFEHKLDLEPKHFRKLIQGKPHTVKIGQIGSGLTIRLGPTNHKKMMMGYNKKKNKVLKLSKEEIDHNMSENMVEGSGFFKTLNKIGISRKQFMGGVRTASKTVAPIIKKDIIPAISAPLGLALATAAGNPELAPIAGIAVNKALNLGADRLDQYGQTGKGMAYQASEFYPNLTKGKGLESDIKKGFNKGINYIKGGSVSIHPVVYNDDGFKPAVNHFSRVIQGSGMQSNDVDHNSLYLNGYMNSKIPLGHQIYKPYVEGGLIYNPNNDPVITARNEALKEKWKTNISLQKKGGSFKPSGY
jgi:hypothetical protein